MKLYEITGEFAEAIELYNSVEKDEELAVVEEKLNGLKTTFEAKAEAVAHYILNLESDIEQITKELARLSALKKKVESEAEWLRGYLLRNMETLGFSKVKGKTVTVSVKNNPPAVVVDNEDEIPGEFTKIVIQTDKAAVREALMEGKKVPGAHLESKKRIDIR